MRQQRGYTLIELVVVAALVAVLTAVALPSFAPPRFDKLDLATSQVAEAVRFGRSEAIRTGNPVYIEINQATDRLLVAEADLGGATAIAGTTLRHPVDLKELDIILSSARTTLGVNVAVSSFNYSSGDTRMSVVFDAQGLPFHKVAGVKQRLTTGTIDLAIGDLARSVTVAQMTGRVIVQ